MLLATLPLMLSDQGALPSGGVPVLAPQAHLQAPVAAGLRGPNATAEVDSLGARRILRVQVLRDTPETNAVQITLPNTQSLAKGDAMLATFRFRGKRKDGGPARVEFLFERSTSPWTKSVTQGFEAPRDGVTWRTAAVPFVAAMDHPAGDAMASLRLAFGPQTVELADIQVVNFRRTQTLESLQTYAIRATPLGAVNVRIGPAKRRQRMEGLGGNFCQPRYGSSEAMDPVGEHALRNLKVRHARIGLPLEHWAPTPEGRQDSGPSAASLRALQRLQAPGRPLVVSVWEGPRWMLPGEREANGKVLPPSNYRACADAIADYLVLARDKYGVTVDLFSFNEPDYGVNFKFTPAEMASFIRVAGPIFRRRKLKTKFLVGDTANGGNFPAYAEPLLKDPTLGAYLGPIAFHSWDALSAPEAVYRRIGELGRRYGKPVWCLEAGHDAQLWQAENPWGTWTNALRTAQAYARTVALTEASVMDYWTYQDNYPLVDKEGKHPFPVFRAMQQMETVLDRGAQVVESTSGRSELSTVATLRQGATHVLLVNSIGAGTATLTGLAPGKMATITTSTAEGQLRSDRMARRSDAQGRLKVNLPARSIVTVRLAP